MQQLDVLNCKEEPTGVRRLPLKGQCRRIVFNYLKKRIVEVLFSFPVIRPLLSIKDPFFGVFKQLTQIFSLLL